jgi:hypothetical protein
MEINSVGVLPIIVLFSVTVKYLYHENGCITVQNMPILTKDAPYKR